MGKWEYAMFDWEGAKMGNIRRVRFTDGQTWNKIGNDELLSVIGRLGDDGWEMVAHCLAAGTTWNTWYFKRPV
jgi:hypothetical protein